jgi:hypothetical protein
MPKFFMPIRNILNFIIALDVDQLAFEIAQQGSFKDLVIELNTEKQLFDKGEDSTGRTLESIGGAYSPFTVSIKQAKGQPTNRVTLFDTGEFYASWSVKPFKGGFIIDADPNKDDTNLFDEWGNEIVGLNEENLQTIINFFRDAVLEKINNRIKAA